MNIFFFLFQISRKYARSKNFIVSIFHCFNISCFNISCFNISLFQCFELKKGRGLTAPPLIFGQEASLLPGIRIRYE